MPRSRCSRWTIEGSSPSWRSGPPTPTSSPHTRSSCSTRKGTSQLQARLIDDILDVSRIVSGKLRLAPETVDIVRVLRAAGANVVPLDSARSALDAINQHTPDLVVTDIAMPEVDGYMLTRTLRELEVGAKMKIIALSAFSSHREEGDGFDAWLSKPIDPFDLVDQIVRVTSRET